MINSTASVDYLFYNDSIEDTRPIYSKMKKQLALSIELDHETDGRWIAEISDIPGVIVYGRSIDEVIEKVKGLARVVIKEQQEYGERPAGNIELQFMIS